jgi:tetratricopeptide (TPR) repeat protein
LTPTSSLPAIALHPLFSLVLSAGLLLAGGCARQAQPGQSGPQSQGAPTVATSAAGVQRYVEAVRMQRSGKLEQAISTLEDAARTNPRLTMTRSLLGDLYKDRGDYSKAADQYQSVAELDPYTGRNFYKLGVAYHLLQQLQNAIASYLQAIKLDAKDWESHMNVGLVYLATGRKDAAISSLTQATIINPGAGVAFGNLAIALDAQGRYPEAEKAYRRALELDAEDIASLGNLGKNLMRQKKTEQAVAVLRKLADLTESSSARKLYADALVLDKKQDAAIKLYDGILKEDSQYYPALNGKGSALISKYEQGFQIDNKQKRAAIDAWKQSLALNPAQPKVAEQLKQWER